MELNLHLKLDEKTNRLLKIYKNLFSLRTLPDAGTKIIKEEMECFEKAIEKTEEEMKRNKEEVKKG